MTTPALIQFSGLVENTLQQTDVLMTNVAAGSTLIAFVAQPGSGVREYAVEDDRNGIWEKPARSGDARTAILFYQQSVAGGDTNVTVSQYIGSANGHRIYVLEIEPSFYHSASGFLAEGNANVHYCAEDGFNIPENAFIISGGQLNSSGGTATPATGAIQLTYDFSTTFLQYRRSSIPLINERSAWSSSTARQVAGVSGVFMAGGGEPVTPVKARHLLAAHHHMGRMR